MRHPEALLLPVMMVGDYLLTVVGAIQRDKGYSLHFKTQHYELNPVWQKHVSERKWLSPRHLLLTIALSAMVVLLTEVGSMVEGLAEGVLGCVFVLYGVILGRHLHNLLLFRYLVRRPDEVCGEITFSHPCVLRISMYQTVMVLIPLSLVAVFSANAFAIGGVGGVILFLVVHLKWIEKARTQRDSSGLANGK